LATFYLGINFPLFSAGSVSYETLIFLIIPVLLVMPIFTSSKTYEFYDNSLIIYGLRSEQKISYTEISSVNNIRGRVLLQFKNQWRQIRIQGTIRSNSSGQDLSEWLSQKIKTSKPVDPDTSFPDWSLGNTTLAESSAKFRDQHKTFLAKNVA
jgi:hypothetical protein